MRFRLIFIYFSLLIYCAFAQELPKDTQFIEDPAYSVGDYTIPNEMGFHYFAPYLKNKKGCLISVGTFRSFQDIAEGNFQLALLADSDDQIVAHNRKQIQLIASSVDRWDYLSKLFGFPMDKKLEPKKLYNALSKHVLKLLSAKTKKTKDIVASLPFSGHYLLELSRMLNPESGPGRPFFTSDIQFKKVQDLAQNGNIYAVRTNLAGEKGIFDIVKKLEANNITVSVLDISNVYEYIDRSPTAIKEQFLKNLESIPFSENAEVLFTSYYFHPSTQNLNSWGYFAHPAKSYIDEAKKFTYSLEHGSKKTPYSLFVLNYTKIQTERDLASQNFSCTDHFSSLKKILKH